MPATDLRPGPPPLPRKRFGWLIALCAIPLLIGLGIYAFCADEPPPDVSDLLVPRLNPPSDQNAYALLTTIALALPPELDEDDLTDEQAHFARIAEDKVAWDQAVVSAGLARYDPDLAAAVRSALQAPFTEAPEIKDYNHLMPEVGGMRRIARILTQRAGLAFRAGNHRAAAELNLLTFRLGDSLAASRGGIIQVLTGTAIQGIAIEAIRTHIDVDSVSAEALREYLTGLADHEIEMEDYFTAYKLEHVMFTGGANDVKTTRAVGIVPSRDKFIGYIMTGPGLYQVNRTRRLHADIIRSILADSLPPRPNENPSASNQLLQNITEAPWPFRARNYTGRIFLGIAVPSFDKVTLTNHRARAQQRLTRLYAALRFHQIEQDGALPATLDELVPTYLPSIPLDPFNGLPVRYDRTLTTIWSVDKERVDITTADDDLPKGAPAQRLRFARPLALLPNFEEFRKQSDQL